MQVFLIKRTVHWNEGLTHNARFVECEDIINSTENVLAEYLDTEIQEIPCNAEKKILDDKSKSKNVEVEGTTLNDTSSVDMGLKCFTRFCRFRNNGIWIIYPRLASLIFLFFCLHKTIELQFLLCQSSLAWHLFQIM